MVGTGSIKRMALVWIFPCVKHADLTLTRAPVWFLMKVACCIVLNMSFREVTGCNGRTGSFTDYIDKLAGQRLMHVVYHKPVLHFDNRMNKKHFAWHFCCMCYALEIWKAGSTPFVVRFFTAVWYFTLTPTPHLSICLFIYFYFHNPFSSPEQAGRDDQRIGRGHDSCQAWAGVHGSAGKNTQSK